MEGAGGVQGACTVFIQTLHSSFSPHNLAVALSPPSPRVEQATSPTAAGVPQRLRLVPFTLPARL